MKFITLTKDKSSLKYYILALICVGCVYSCKISDLFIPLFDNVYYGNLVEVFINLSNFIIWIIEFLAIFFVCKKLNIKIFTEPERKKELSLLRLIIFFVMTIMPMIIISAYLGFTIKLVFNLGGKVTIVGFLANLCNWVSWGSRLVLITLFIHFVHLAIEKNIKFNKPCLNEYFPWGAILSLLIFGLLDFFFISPNLKAFYLFLTFYYGIIYLLSGRKFSSSYVANYLIWLF